MIHELVHLARSPDFLVTSRARLKRLLTLTFIKMQQLSTSHHSTCDQSLSLKLVKCQSQRSLEAVSSLALSDSTTHTRTSNERFIHQGLPHINKSQTSKRRWGKPLMGSASAKSWKVPSFSSKVWNEWLMASIAQGQGCINQRRKAYLKSITARSTHLQSTFLRNRSEIV